MGLVNVFVYTLLTPLLVLTSAVIPPNQLGITWSVVGGLFFIGIMDNVISDLLWAKAVILTSPTVATVALSMTVPLAVGGDFFLGREVGWGRGLGAAGVTIGFFMVNLE